MERLIAASLVAILVAGATPATAELTVPSQAGWDAAREKVTLADGLTLAYVKLGTGDGTPLVLIHGYTDNSRSWSLLAPELGDRTIYAVDLRGHGASDIPACCYGLDSLAHDIIGFMDAMGIEKADLVGHSLGSMTAGVVAGLAPERVEHLVLISSALNTPQESADWLWENVPALEHPIAPDSAFMESWYWNPHPVDTDFLSREMAESAARPAEVWNGVLTGLTLADWTPLATRITAPVMILWGDQDSLFGADAQTELQSALPAASFHSFESYGHNLFWETPAEVGALISEFIGE